MSVKRGTLHPAVAFPRKVQAPEVRKEAQERGAEAEGGGLRTAGHWVGPDSEGRLSSATPDGPSPRPRAYPHLQGSLTLGRAAWLSEKATVEAK